MEENESNFDLNTLNNDMTISYISKLMTDEQTQERDFKKKKSAVSIRRVDSVYENFNELKEIDFESAIFNDVEDFDFSQYKLPKDEFLKEKTMNRILGKKEMEIDTRLRQINNKEDEMASKKIIERSDVHNPFLKSHNIEVFMDKNEAKIEELLHKLKANEQQIEQEEKPEDYKPNYEQETESITEAEEEQNSFKQKINIFEDLEKSICKLIRRA